MRSWCHHTTLPVRWLKLWRTVISLNYSRKVFGRYLEDCSEENSELYFHERSTLKTFFLFVLQQEIKARHKKNLFSIVEQLQWKQRREERLSQNPSTQTDCSIDSDISTPALSNRQQSTESPLVSAKPALCRLGPAGKWTSGSSSPIAAISPAENKAKPCLSDCSSLVNKVPKPIDVSKRNSEPSRYRPQLTRQYSRSNSELEQVASSLDYGPSKSDDELLGQSDGDVESSAQAAEQGSYKLVDISDQETEPVCSLSMETEDDHDTEEREIRYSNPTFPLLGHTSSSEDNLTTSNLETYSLPNGMVILSPDGDVFARSASSGKNILVRPKTLTNFKNFSRNLPESMKMLPLKDNRVKSTLSNHGQILGRLKEDSITNELESANLSSLTKEELYLMWKTSEREWNKKLKKALQEKAELEQKLSQIHPDTDTWSSIFLQCWLIFHHLFMVRALHATSVSFCEEYERTVSTVVPSLWSCVVFTKPLPSFGANICKLLQPRICKIGFSCISVTDSLTRILLLIHWETMQMVL